jgi:hypothetical protein
MAKRQSKKAEPTAEELVSECLTAEEVELLDSRNITVKQLLTGAFPGKMESFVDTIFKRCQAKHQIKLPALW